MDDFEKAIIYSFDQSGGIDAQLRAQAMAYCEQAKQSPTILHACIEKFGVSQFAEVQFWCLQTLEELIRVRYGVMDHQERLFLQTTLLAMLCSCGADGDALPSDAQQDSRANPKPAFVKNKLAQIIVILIYIDYPHGWPSVFLDLLGSLAKGPAIVEMFCRVLISLDEEVISLDYPRKPEEIAVATRIKDAMRQQCVTQIVGSCYSLVMAYKAVKPPLAAMVLQTLQRYAAWIDISLVANDTFLAIFFDFILSPQEDTDLRGAAVDCLLAIASKKMDALSKLALLQRLQISRLCGHLSEKQDSEFCTKLGSFIIGFATEVIECSKKLQASETSHQTVSLVEALLDAVLPSVFYLLQFGDEDISSTSFQFFSNYISTMKALNYPSGNHTVHVTQVLKAILNRMRYDPTDKASLDGPDKVGKEEEERMSEYRKDLLGLFRTIHRLAPDVTRGFVKTTLSEALGRPDLPFEDVEAAITLFYILGEGLDEETGGAAEEMVIMLFSAQISCHSHRLVALTFLETVIRYVRFVHQHPEYIPMILGVFLDKRGIHHANPNVSGRASYLFMRFVRILRLQLLPYIESILQSLQDILAGFTAGKALLRKGQATSFEDGSHAFEAIGLLLGMEDLPEDKQTKFLSALLVPLCSQVESLLGNLRGEDSVGPPDTVAALQQAIVAINSLSKGFGEQLATSTRPSVGALFKQALDVLLRVLKKLPQNKLLRSKVISFLHRMVDTLGRAVFPFLHVAFQQLLVESEPREMVEVLILINQLMSKFKSEITDLVQELFPFIVGQIFALLPKEAFPDGASAHTEEVQALQELQRVYFTFLQAIAVNHLSSTFLSSKSSHILNDIFQSVLFGSCEHKDVLVRKVCVQIFVCLIKDWCGACAEEEKVPGFRRFVIETFAPKCCVYSVLERSFDLRDANTFSLFGEIVSAQKVIYEQYGDEFLIHQATKVFPAVHCPPNLAEQYCLHIQRSEMKDLKSFYKSLVEKLKPEQNGSMVLR